MGLRDVGDLFTLGEGAVEELRSLADGATASPQSAGLRLASPVRRPSKIVCVGLNYLAHIEESGGTKPDRNVLFAKFPSCIVGSGEDVVMPSITRELDYEGELGVVIGRKAKGVAVSDALSYVGGYTVVNDVSARDLQIAEPQWIRGKALDTFAPVGPVVVDVASAPPIEKMRIVTTVNGEVRQDAMCSMMITTVPALIAHISQQITLEPGDIIATGTPSGVALGMSPQVYLQPGHVMTVEINGIGKLTNTVTTS
jgi:2-keto-4-pentenoate hydratase/2-oxohepta-3-ene-1,7-dioic acid hydratase in catechol pathway